MSPTTKPTVIAGPCAAESYAIMAEVAECLSRLSKRLDFNFVFKASFDKANRTSIDSYRGPGLKQAMAWFAELRANFSCKVLTDVHETAQIAPLSEVVDSFQIPAFLCRQTDLLLGAVATKKPVNIKKGQFLAPESILAVVGKVRKLGKSSSLPPEVSVTERGTCFGYGDLVVDMRAFATLAQAEVPLFFDVTHSTQRPPTGQGVTGADRLVAPLLARAATATGYLDGYYIEVHPEPCRAQSDREAQLSIPQLTALLEQIVPLWHRCRNLNSLEMGWD